MKTAEEILDMCTYNTFDDYDKSTFIKAMKMYANSKLDEAANQATLWVETPFNGTEFDIIKENIGYQTDPVYQVTTVFKQSILILKDEIQ